MCLHLFWPDPSPSHSVPEASFKLVLPPINDIQIVIGEPAPLFFGLALELFPVPFDAIPVHVLLHVNSDFVNDGIDRTFPMRNSLIGCYSQ